MAALRQKLQLLRGVINGEKAFGGPLYVNVEVTRRCNLTCLGCPYHSSLRGRVPLGDPAVQDVPLEHIESLCRELPRLGTREIVLVGGGEPLLHPRLCDIVSAFKDAGCTVELFTNGTLIDRTYAEAILDSRLDIVRVSLWASSVEEYRLCHPGVSPDFFERTLSGVKAVTDLKTARGVERPKVLVTQPLNRHNCASIGARIRLAHDLGCNGLAFRAYRHGRGEFASTALTAEQIHDVSRELRHRRKTIESLSLEHNIDRLLLRYRLGETAWRDLPCYAGWFFTEIQVDGTVVPCGSCALPMGNLRDAGFAALWNGPRYRAFRRQASNPGGLAALGSACDCAWCCYARDNFLTHRYARWVSQVLPKRQGPWGAGGRRSRGAAVQRCRGSAVEKGSDRG
jgi:MoaA/NifB/PqqE/SkfB family radical SAM enzyme